MPKPTPEPSENIAQQTLQATILCTIVCLIPIAAHNYSPRGGQIFWTMCIALSLLTGIAYLIRQGKREAVVQVALWGLLACVLSVVLSSPYGVHSVAMLGMPALLVVAAVLLSTRQFSIFAASIILVCGSVAALETLRLLGSRKIQAHYSTVIDVVAVLSVAAIAAGLLARNLKLALEASREDSRRLAEQNHLIEEQRRLVEAQKCEIEQLLSKAEEASRLKSEFLANMSHEVRTPMNAVIGMAQLALAEQPDPTQREYLSTIVQSGEGLMVILNDILDLSKIEAGHLEIVSTPFALREAVDSATQLLRIQARGKGLEFGRTVAADLPEWFTGDAGRLRQVLVNLLGNAVKFTDRGKVWLHVSGQEAKGQTWELRFAVMDEGPGIPKELLRSVFDPFTQVDGSHRRRQGGAGLGLTISARIAERMGGTIDAYSSPGHGSTFVFTVPFSLAPAGVIQPPTPILNPRAAVKRILVAEDNPVNQLLARKMIEKLGHEAVVAPDGKTALELALRQPFDLVLMDVQMPQMDGLEAARKLRESSGGRRIPIIAMTAHAMAGDRETCLSAGMTDYLPKPLTLAELAQAIERACPSAADGDGAVPLTSGEVPSEAPISTHSSAHS